MRLFLAVFPPAGVQAAAHAVIESLRAPDDGVSWVKRENLHVTLRFLGEVDEDGARRAAESATEAAASAPAFAAALGSPGAFPSARRARVLWLGLDEGAERLVALARALDVALRRRGFGIAGPPFSPHLTLGRVRRPSRDWTGALGISTRFDGAVARFTVNRVSVIESTLSPRGSIYRERAAAELAP